MTAPTELTRPIIGIENRTAQEVFDIMCDRIRSALVSAPAVPDAVAADWQRIDDALVSCASLIRALASDDIATVAAAELDYVRSALASVKE